MVISILLILVSIAAPIYKTSILHAREAVLRDDLFTMRSLIGSNDSWAVDQEDTLLSVDQQEPGIIDVHSGSSQTSSEGTAYNTW